MQSAMSQSSPKTPSLKRFGADNAGPMGLLESINGPLQDLWLTSSCLYTALENTLYECRIYKKLQLSRIATKISGYTRLAEPSANRSLQKSSLCDRTHNYRKYDDTSATAVCTTRLDQPGSRPMKPGLPGIWPSKSGARRHATQPREPPPDQAPEGEAGASRFLIRRLRGFPYHFRSWILEPLRNPTAPARKPCACPGAGLVEPPAFLNLGFEKLTERFRAYSCPGFPDP